MFGFVNDESESEEDNVEQQVTGEEIAGALTVEEKGDDQEMVQQNEDDDRDPYMLDLEKADDLQARLAELNYDFVGDDEEEKEASPAKTEIKSKKQMVTPRKSASSKASNTNLEVVKEEESELLEVKNTNSA